MAAKWRGEEYKPLVREPAVVGGGPIE
jgi:hypothetical protein